MDNRIKHRRNSFQGAGLTDGLVAYWPMDETSGDRLDDHTNSLDLTDVNTVGNGTGTVYGTAADFEEGSSEYFERASSSLLEPTDMTVSLWLNPESLSGALMPVFGKHDSTGSEQSYLLYYYPPDSKLYWAVYHSDNSVTQANTAASPFSTATWYHVIVTCDDQNELAIIIDDGTPVTTAVTKSLASSTAKFGVSTYHNGGSPIAGSFWDGLIGPMAMWDRVLTASEITTLHNSGSGLEYSEL